MRVLLILVALVPVLNALQVNLKHLRGGMDTPGKILIEYEVSNDEQDTVRVLKHNTPFETFRDTLVGDPFDIVLKDTHQHPLYLGVLMKHMEPTNDDYITLAPGESKSTVVDLASGYQMNSKGTYLVRPIDTGFGFVASNEIIIRQETGDDYLVQQEYDLDEPVENVTALNCGVATILNNCRSGDLTAIRNSWRQASQCIPSLPVYNNANPRDSNTIRWLGGSGANLGNVQNGYRRCQQLLCRQGTFSAGARASCDYGCSAYAYVYPTDRTHTIYLCSAYFRAPATGRDSKFGTVIHEAVHFNTIHTARDHQYGCVGCQNLARSNFNTARVNSDSLEFNAEFSGYFTPVPNC